MNIGEIISGFKLLRRERIDEVDSVCLVFEHVKTGARLIKLENSDDNKVFGVGFRTPPTDSTGVAHIVEHSVLSGSRKYRTKEPFMDMYKGSLQTFLNAMTFSDKTIYPVASRNAADFRNLMDVYLDAVFYPAISEVKEIFLQEGWHYELLDKDEPIVYKGVVYNEMRGAMSTPEDQFEAFMDMALYPDTIYSFNSGGDPYEIPNLTYENFLEFHRRYYHPSNSYIFLYGDGDTSKELGYIQDEYLVNFDRLEIDSSISDQERFKIPQRRDFEYSTTDPIDDLELDYLAYGTIFGNSLDGYDRIMCDILKEALVESDAAPIKLALYEKGLGEDIFSSGYAGKQLPFFIVSKNTSVERIDEFESTIDEVLNKIVEEGIDEKLMLSTINKLEYAVREAGGYPTRGIIYYIESLKSWLYDADPLEPLRYNDMMETLRRGVKEGLFERYIKERLLENTHKVIVSAVPKRGLNEELDEKTAVKLAEYKASLTDEQIEKLIEENKKLVEYQSSEDSEEAKETIPRLSLDEVNRKLELIPRHVSDIGGITVLYHDIFTAGINYLDLVFDISHIAPDEVPYVMLLSEMLGSVDTVERDYKDLAKDIYIKTGGLALRPRVYTDHQDRSKFYPKLEVSSRMIGSDLTQMIKLFDEILTGSVLTDQKRFKEIVQELKSGIEMSIFQNGSNFVSGRVRSYLVKSAKYNEMINGFDFYNFIQELESDIENSGAKYIEILREVYGKLFNTGGLILNLTGDESARRSLVENIGTLIDKLPSEEQENRLDELELNTGNEGIASSANVQYVAKGATLQEMGVEYNGKLSVLSSLLSRDYLHNNIRAKGGAYGAGFTANKTSIEVYSYRDPNLEKTVEVYDEMDEYLNKLELTEADLTRYIIGTVGKFDPPLTAVAKGAMDLGMFIQGMDISVLEGYISEALETTVGDLKAYAGPIGEAMKRNHLCVLGSEHAVKANEGLFDSVINLKK